MIRASILRCHGRDGKTRDWEINKESGFQPILWAIDAKKDGQIRDWDLIGICSGVGV